MVPETGIEPVIVNLPLICLTSTHTEVSTLIFLSVSLSVFQQIFNRNHPLPYPTLVTYRILNISTIILLNMYFQIITEIFHCNLTMQPPRF